MSKSEKNGRIKVRRREDESGKVGEWEGGKGRERTGKREKEGGRQ